MCQRNVAPRRAHGAHSHPTLWAHHNRPRSRINDQTAAWPATVPTLMVRHRTCYTAHMGSDVGRKRRVPYGVGARYRTDSQRGAVLNASIGAYRRGGGGGGGGGLSSGGVYSPTTAQGSRTGTRRNGTREPRRRVVVVVVGKRVGETQCVARVCVGKGEWDGSSQGGTW